MEDIINNTLQKPTEYNLFVLFHDLKKRNQTTNEFEELLIDIHGNNIKGLINKVNSLVNNTL